MAKRLTKKEKEKALERNRKFLRKLFKKKTNIIGIDIGTYITGFYSGKEGACAIHGGTKNHIIKRTSIIKTSFISLLKKPLKTMAIMEDYSYGLRGSTLAQLAQLGGIIRVSLYEFGIPFILLTPMQLKKFVLGPSKGSGDKALMLVTVLDRWGVKFEDHNCCDAYCLVKFATCLKEYVFETGKFVKWECTLFDDFIANRGIPTM